MLLVIDHAEGAGHQEIETKVEWPQGYCVWANTEDDLEALVRYCSICVDYHMAGLAPRQLDHTVYGMELDAEVLFDFSYLLRD